jgi:hypothetical protein
MLCCAALLALAVATAAQERAMSMAITSHVVQAHEAGAR